MLYICSIQITNPSTNVDPFSDMNNQNSIDADFSKTDAFKNGNFFHSTFKI